MEFIIGCIFTLILIAFLYFFCKNVTFTVKIEYPSPEVPELNDIYDDNGDTKDSDKTIDYDALLKEINNLFLGEEEEPNE